MKKISKKTSLPELGAIVCESLRQHNIDAFLSGGACVSIYTKNKYESYDLDFISYADRTKIKKVMLELGFSQEKSRLYTHPDSAFMVEFPGTAMQVGNEVIEKFNELTIIGMILKVWIKRFGWRSLNHLT